MDDFNKPLGVNKNRPLKNKAGGRQAGNWAGMAGLVMGTTALAFVGWQYVAPPVTDNNQAQTGEQVVHGNNTDGKSEGAATTLQQDEEPDSNMARDSGQEDGQPGLQELEPSGRLAVPKPRPPRVRPQDQGLAHLPDPELVERGATGVIPQRGPDGRRPMDVYAREPDTTGNFGVARVVLIVGGMGISQTASQQAIRKLPPTVNLAFAPYGNSLLRWMQEARKKGHEILLQIPMEPFGYPASSPGPHTLTTSASEPENLANLHWLMSRITNYVGVMSFQGARMLAEPASLKPVFDELAERGLLFVDEGTAGNSKAAETASQSVLAHATGQVQLDAKRTRRDIAEQIEVLVREAKRTGLAIGISSGFPETIDILAEFAGKANSLGVEITPVSAVVKDPERDQ